MSNISTKNRKGRTIVSFLFLFGILILPLGSVGCDCRKRSGSAIDLLTQEGRIEKDGAHWQKEIFDRELEQLNSLEDAPCLPETTGGEKLVQAADRLNKWIREQRPDESWKPDETFLALETQARKAAILAHDIVRLMHLLQEKEVLDEQENPVKPTESLEEERKRVSEFLTQIGDELKTLANLSGVPGMAMMSNQATELRKKFAGLETIRNLNAARIRAFAKQLEAETALFVSLAEGLDKFAEELRIEGLFLRLADVEYLKQCIWLRDIAQWARGEKQDTLLRIRNLFDWTVCNIDLKERSVFMGREGNIELPQQYPWQSLLLGHSTVWDRAWIFIELLRQQRIDAGILSVPHPEAPEGGAAEPLFWGVGVLLDGQIHLFLPQFGVPLPGPGSPVFAEDGTLSFDSVATLAQAIEDDKLLRRLDLSEERRFPITSAMLRNSTLWLAASPETVSMRMKVLEAELSGEQNMVLSTNIAEQRRRFGALKEIASVDVWRHPIRTKFEQIFMFRVTNDLMSAFLLPNPKREHFPLWSGRVLYFKGKITGQESAMTRYQEARVPDREIMEYRTHAVFRNDPLQEQLMRMVTANANYWLGLAAFEIDSIQASKDFFAVLESNSRNPWRTSVEFMLGRIAEREKNHEEAIRRFERAADGPAADGNRLRAKWIRERTSEQTPP